MLHFLSTLFSPAEGRSGMPDRDLIERATERAVDGTDPRLRVIGNYRKRLREPVEQAVIHVLQLVDDLPAPVEISRRGFSTDPRVRAFFASTAHLQELLGSFKSLTDYLRDIPGPHPDDIYGLLSMEWKERNILGVGQHGDVMRRDVAQVAVSFFNHRLLGPAGNETDTRWELKKRAFDYLIEMALEQIVAARGKRHELRRQQQLLSKKLVDMKAGNWGLETMLSDTEAEHPDLRALEADIKASETELLQLGADSESLERSLDYLAETLGQPAKWMSRRDLNMRLDHMGIKTRESSGGAASDLELTELFSASGERRIVLLGRIPCAELPERPDFFKQARRYLG